MSEAGNVLKEDEINIIIPGNILKELGLIVLKAGNKLKEDKRNLKNLGKGIIFVETFRENWETVFDFGLRNGGTKKLGIAIAG